MTNLIEASQYFVLLSLDKYSVAYVLVLYLPCTKRTIGPSGYFNSSPS